MLTVYRFNYTDTLRSFLSFAAMIRVGAGGGDAYSPVRPMEIFSIFIISKERTVDARQVNMTNS